MQDNRTPRPSAVQLRSAAAQLEYHGNTPVASWLREVATQQDELELRQSIAERTGRDVDDEWVIAARAEGGRRNDEYALTPEGVRAL